MWSQIKGGLGTVPALFGTAFSRAKAALTSRLCVSSEGSMPSLHGATAWLNSDPLTTAQLRGKVVLVQIWSYTCIEWLRTAPYVSAWSDRYGAQGLVVIGVHTPESSFEHDVENVRRAVQGLGLRYPIAIDNHYTVSEGFKNRYTPTLYFVDAKGRIRRRYEGEGEYGESERFIGKLLRETGAGILPRELAPPA